MAKLWYGRVRKRKRAYHGEKVGSSLKRRRDLTMARVYIESGAGGRGGCRQQGSRLFYLLES